MKSEVPGRDSITSRENRIQRRLRWFSAGAGAVAAGIGSGFLFAWLSGMMTYRGLSAITMKTNAALSLLLCGVALVLVPFANTRNARLLSQGLATLAMAIGCLTFSEHVFGFNLGIDQLLAREPAGAVGVLHPNRMGPPASACFALGGFTILLLIRRRPSAWRVAQRVAIVLCLIPLTGLLGYLFGVRQLYGIARFTDIAWPTAVALLFLGLGMLCGRPEAGFMARFSSLDPGGAAIRRLLPAVILAPIVLGWFRLEGQRHGLYETDFGTIILVLSLVVGFSALVYKTGTWISTSAEAMRQSEERFRIAQELSPDGFTILRPLRDPGGAIFDFVWVYENPAIARMNGTDPEAVVGRRLLELLPGHVSTPFHELYCRVAQTGHSGVLEASYHGDTIKEKRWFRVAVVPLGADIAILAQNITEKRLVEEQLRQSQEKFSKAFASNPAAMVITRLRDGTFVEVNEAWQSMFGYGFEETIGHTAHDLHIWPEPPQRDRVLEELEETGSLRSKELTLQRRSGDRFVALASAELVTLADEKLGLWSLVDITERKRTEEALREREELLQLFVNHAPAALAMFDRDMRYLYVSRRWKEMYRVGDRDLRGMSHYEVFPDISAQWKDYHRRALEGEVHRAEIDRYERADGSVQWIRWEIRPWYTGAGEVGGIVIFAEDMTGVVQAEESLRQAKDGLETRVRERTRELELTYSRLQRETEDRLATVENLRKNEELLLQQSRLAAMGEMLGNIAHQWRQPLNNLALILQHLSLDCEMGELSRDDLAGRVTKAMDLILHMSRTIDDFSSFLQPDREEKPFDVHAAIATTLSLFEATLTAMNVSVEVKGEGQLYTVGHRNAFCQVISNLVTNARDIFGERQTKSPKLVIELAQQDQSIVVTISDNAGGIPETIIGKVFEPYFTTKGPQGTGIGLFMSKNIVEKSLKGALTVRNSPEGAEFRIRLRKSEAPRGDEGLED